MRAKIIKPEGAKIRGLLVREKCHLARTSCSAVVTNDRQQVVCGDLGRALFGQERLHVEALQGEGHVAADLEGIHHLVAETFQMNAQNLRAEKHENKQIMRPTTGTTGHLQRLGCYQELTSGSLSTLQYLTPFLNLQRGNMKKM